VIGTQPRSLDSTRFFIDGMRRLGIGSRPTLVMPRI
jgi:hypothetical protein